MAKKKHGKKEKREVNSEQRRFAKPKHLINSDADKAKYIDELTKHVASIGLPSDMPNFATTSAIMKKRIAAEQAFEDKAISVIKKQFQPDSKMGFSELALWLDICFGTTQIYINESSCCPTPYVAAAIWVLDKIDQSKNTNRLIQLLSEEEYHCDLDYINYVPDGITHHPQSLILLVANIIAARNSGCSKLPRKLIRYENFVNDIIARQEHRKYPSDARNLFDCVIALISEKYLNEALKHSESLIWRFAEGLIETLAPVDQRLLAAQKQTQKNFEIAEKHANAKSNLLNICKPGSPCQNVSDLIEENSKTAFEQIVRDRDALAMIGNQGGYLSYAIDDTIALKSKMYICEYIKQESVYNILSLSHYNKEIEISKFGNKAYQDALRSFVESCEKANLFDLLQITYPEEFIFSIIYMFDRGYDAAYLLFASSPLLYSAIRHLPFGFPSRNKSKTFRKEAPSATPQFFKDIVSNKKFLLKDETLPAIPIAHIFWKLSGVYTPSLMNTYMRNYKKLSQFQMPDDYKTALAFGSSMLSEMRISATKEESLPDRISGNSAEKELKEDQEERHEESAVQTMSNPHVENVKKENKDLRSKNQNLITELKYSKEKLQKANDEIAQLTQELDKIKKENEILTASRKITEIAESTDDIQFPYILKHKFAVFGCYDKWAVNMKELLLGDIEYDTVSSSHYTKEFVKNSDVVCIYVRGIAHSPYYSIIDLAKTYGKTILYLNAKNETLNAKEIVTMDRQF